MDESRSCNALLFSCLFLTWIHGNGCPSFTLAKKDDFVIDHATEAAVIHAVMSSVELCGLRGYMRLYKRELLSLDSH